MPSLSFTYAIYWIRKDVIIEKITYGWYIFVSTIFILIVFLLMLFGRILLAFYFYLVVSIGLCFSIAYSSNSYFTKLVLVFMSYFLARVFDSEVLLGRFVKSYDKSAIVRDFFHAIHKCFGYFAKVDNTRMLRFYIDEADKSIDDMDIKFMVADDFSFKDVSEITIRYNSNAPRSAHYIKNIRYSTSFLTIMVNDETMDDFGYSVQSGFFSNFRNLKLRRELGIEADNGQELGIEAGNGQELGIEAVRLIEVGNGQELGIEADRCLGTGFVKRPIEMDNNQELGIEAGDRNLKLKWHNCLVSRE
ncbi:hypothetical protein RhiirC2_855049 [Rhizophagus irregularis]|uniref:Uncharacterized protein n=1 Tax=Rhizophagus irregularis TaxID=588596 RepID=A0A2N1MP37_9GLOM|nr:hypothetical protein RhiirC2_855049 [Rhizophagus irregularis]